MLRLPLLAGLAACAFSQSGIVPMRFANVPACPAAKQSKDTMLLRAEDQTGLGVEVWCERQGPGYAYAFKLRGADGRAIPLDRCIYSDGINAVGVDHSGTVSESRTPEGALVLKTSGRIARFFHNNWDTLLGHHAIYDFAGRTMTYYGSEAYRDPMGRWTRLLTGAGSAGLSGLPQAGTLGKLNAERTFDPARQGCATASADDGQRIHQEVVDAYNEPGKLGKSVIAWPESTPIDRIEFNARDRKLLVKFPAGTRKTTVSLAFARGLLGIGKEITKVRLDGRFVPVEEYISSTHRTVRITIDEPAKEALLTESGGFPFFLVSSIALVGGLIIGTVVALLFRRKLPAVPQDPEPENA
jgi:hypothetical protein